MSTKVKSEPAIPVLPNGEAETKSCWSCGDMRAANFCSSCGKVQPPAPTDYFSFFGMSRRLQLDTAELEREMFSLSRRLHPDLYARASHEEQDWSLQQTSKLNDAYRTLRDPILRTEYLLRLEGIKLSQRSKQATELARSTGEKKQSVPPDLLEEVFELNMQLEQFRANRKLGEDDPELRSDLETARRNLAAKLEAGKAELKARWQEWDELIAHETEGQPADTGRRRALLEQMLDVLNRRRYVDNLMREISTTLSE